MLIDRARVALRERRLLDAMIALMSHERRFSTGALAEDREYLMLDALRQSGREGQMRERAARFLARFPSSAHADEVRRRLE